MTRSTLRLLNIIAAALLLLSLALIARLWSFSYFWVDDFGNVFWVQSLSATEILHHLVNPLSTYFRPLGLLFYWVLYHSFGLNPVPYHLVAWLLHALNTYLLFLILRRLLRSPFAAVAGTIPFAFRVNFADMYWSFGTIFELLACGLVFAGLYVYIRKRLSFVTMMMLTGVFFLAIKSKEMAITLPAVWLLYDLIVSRDLLTAPRKVALRMALPALIVAWFTLLRISTMCDLAPDNPYRMDLRLQTVVDGFGMYFSWLYPLKLPALLWTALIVVALIAAALTKQRLALFFLCYTIVTFTPVILLPNHRWPYFWYIPFLGIAGLFGLGAREASHWLRRQQIPLRRLAVIHLALLIAWSTVNNTVEYLRSRKVRAVQAGHANTFTAYVRTLNKLDPEPDATLYFVEAPPRFFSTDVLNSSVQVALHRPDLHARLVDKFPEGTKWKLLLSKGEVQRSIEDEVIRKTGAEQSPDPILTSDAEPPRPEPKPCFSSPIQRLLRNLTGGG